MMKINVIILGRKAIFPSFGAKGRRRVRLRGCRTFIRLMEALVGEAEKTEDIGSETRFEVWSISKGEISREGWIIWTSFLGERNLQKGDPWQGNSSDPKELSKKRRKESPLGQRKNNSFRKFFQKRYWCLKIRLNLTKWWKVWEVSIFLEKWLSFWLENCSLSFFLGVSYFFE